MVWCGVCVCVCLGKEIVTERGIDWGVVRFVDYLTFSMYVCMCLYVYVFM